MYPSRHYLYPTWSAIRQRCHNPKHPKYQHYGGRGIKVCDRWKDFYSFVEDMGDRPDGSSLDRIDNDKDYTPRNCRWTNNITQRLNQSKRAISKSGYLGVSKISYDKELWAANITVEGKTMRFGRYTNVIEAAYIADQIRIAFYGEKVPMNFLGDRPYYPEYIDG